MNTINTTDLILVTQEMMDCYEEGNVYVKVKKQGVYMSVSKVYVDDVGDLIIETAEY